jgi:hypothetical protein
MELQVSWNELKSFYVANSKTSLLNYIEIGAYYFIICEFRQIKINTKVFKNSDEATDFETSFKALCNKNEAERVRITTNRLGRKLHDRYVRFFTSDPTSLDNTDFNENDYGDITLTMKKVEIIDNVRTVTTTTNPSECKETWLDFEATKDIEISAGFLSVPQGATQDAWELHVIGAPDIPQAYGGSHHFVANSWLKWDVNQNLVLDASLNPAEIPYNAAMHTGKIRFILKHPVGVSEEFRLNLKMFM